MRKLIVTFSVIVAVCCLASSQSAPKLSLDKSKPFVYISLEHIGPRPPVEEREPDIGLWLRIVNNSALPIEVITMGTSTRPELLLVADEVIGRETRIDPRNPVGEMPPGYSTGIGSPTPIAPGKSIVFSVPANHVGTAWYMRVPFRFQLPPVQGGEQPICYAEFSLENIPENLRPKLRGHSER